MGSRRVPGTDPWGGAGMVAAVLHLTRRTWMEMVGHAYDVLPDEACGLLAGPPGTDRCTAFYPCRNAAESSRVYTIDPKDHLRADRHAEDLGLEINGVMHSHTHTDAYPSPTDVAQAPRSEEHTSELQSLMRISYAVFCLKKKN